MGLDKHILTKLINSSTGQCWSSQSYNPCPDVIPNVPSNNDYNGGFACELMRKDLRFALGIPFFLLFLLSISISLDAAQESQTTLPLTEEATQIYDQICSNGWNRKDFSVVFQYLQDLRQ